MLNIYDYIANSKYYKTYRVDDLLLVEYKCMIPEDRVAFWTHTNYFAYILSGEATYYLGDQVYVVERGRAMFVRKGAYVAQQHRKGDYCALIFFLPDDFIQHVTSKYPNLSQGKPRRAASMDDGVFSIPVDDSLTAFFHSVLSYFPNDTEPSEQLLKLKFEELLLNIMTNQQNPDLATYLAGIRENGKVSIRDVMERSFMYPMSLDEYARLCARSLSTFKTDFQAAYNMSPGKWLIRARLQFARTLLETTNDTVTEIATKSGFRNTAHFVKVFKEAYGAPPLQYRLREISMSVMES